MFRYKSNKKAFVMTALVILLCLVCLAGATLALFTNDPNDGTIGIITTTGEVRVDIVNSDNVEKSLVGGVLEFQTNSASPVILFEPGAMFCTQGFKVKNTGTIPIKFRLSVSDDDGIDMAAFKDGFDFWISTSSEKPEEVQELDDFYGRLAAGECSESTYYLFIKMKETADDDFQGKTYSGIGITVYAVQENAELRE